MAALLDSPRPIDLESGDLDLALIDLDAEWAQIVDQISRREFIRAGAAGTLAVGVAAALPDSSAATDRSTRLVSSVHGEVRVPSAPKRVISTDDYSMATLFDLDFRHLVGVYSAGAEYVEPQYLARWHRIQKISGGTVGGAIDVEKVAALRPDLIIGIDATDPPYGQLKEIAPTVVMPFSKARVPWSAMAIDTARTVNQQSALAALQRRYADTATRIRQTYASVLAKTRWDIIQGGFNAGEYWLYGPQSSIGVILAKAGARFGSASRGVHGTNAQPVSYEQIGKLHDAEAIFYYATNAGKPANLGPQLFAQPLFRKLPAVKAGRTYGTVYFLAASYGDAIDALKAFEHALQRLSRGGR